MGQRWHPLILQPQKSRISQDYQAHPHTHTPSRELVVQIRGCIFSLQIDMPIKLRIKFHNRFSNAKNEQYIKSFHLTKFSLKITYKHGDEKNVYYINVNK